MLPQLLQGVGMTLFFVPITVISLGAVEPRETASAAGILSFARSLAAAMGTSIYTTMWANQGRADQTALAGTLNDTDSVIARLQATGMDHAAALAAFSRQVEAQAVMLATSHIFQIAAVAFFFAATTIWLAPKPPKNVDTSSAH